MSTDTYYAVREASGYILPMKYPGKRAAIQKMRQFNQFAVPNGQGQTDQIYDLVRVTITTTTEFIDTRDAPPDNGHHISCMCSRCM